MSSKRDSENSEAFPVAGDSKRQKYAFSVPSRDDNIRLRSYQSEMVEESLKRNVIVAMDTGSGKTHIAAARMAIELERCSASKRVWFLAPTVTLCKQQFKFIQNNLPAYESKLLIGEDNVDAWSTQTIWDTVLCNIRIVISTHAILRDALTHGFVKLKQLALLVFDEAHHAIEEHPANQIMKQFYFPLKAQDPFAVPSILGLSASPVMSIRKGAMSGVHAVVGNLDAVAVTPRRSASELAQYVHRPEFLRVEYPDAIETQGTPSTAEALVDLLGVESRMTFDNDPYTPSHQEPYFNKKRKTYSQQQVEELCRKAGFIQKSLGTWATAWYINMCISKFISGIDRADETLFDLSREEKLYLRAILSDVRDVEVPPFQNERVSAKVECLVDLLILKYDSGFRGLIFAEQRAVVATLAELLSRHPKLQGLFRVGTTVGTSSAAKRKASIAELADMRSQLKDLEDFRAGAVNLMIGTDVLEEGIDIPECGTVICFDPPKNLKSFIQRRGRARRAASQYYVFDDHTLDPNKWRKHEEEMKRAYEDDVRQIQALSEREETSEHSNRSFRVQSTGALLTYENAVAHLSHFCATLASGQHTDLRPEFNFIIESASSGITAEVTLPAALDPSLRRHRSLQDWKTENMAKKDAAFQAYVKLHEAGLVNDHLLPALPSVAEDLLPEVEKRPGVVSVLPEHDPWFNIDPRKAVEHWYETSICALESETEVIEVFMLLPVFLPEIPPFALYWNKDVQYNIRTTASPVPVQLNPSELMKLREETQLLLRTIRDQSVPEGKQDFIALFSSRTRLHRLEEHSQQSSPKPWMAVLQNARDVFVNGTSVDNKALIRINGLMTERPVLFQGFTIAAAAWPPEINDTLAPEERGTLLDVDEPYVLYTKFPKRRDFLHPIPENEPKSALSQFSRIPARCCAVDTTPFEVALLSAFVPSINHRYECWNLANHLNQTLLAPLDIRNLGLVLTAITAPSAMDGRDYQRLEFVGDTVLKLLLTLRMMVENPTWPEGYLTRRRALLINNNYLSKMAIRAGLERYIITKTFTGAHWKPKRISEITVGERTQTIERSTKVMADVVEAVIGASYVEGGLAKAQKCGEILLALEQDHTITEYNNVLREHAPSTFSSDSGFVQDLEIMLGYSFTNRGLLLEALTHPSFNSTANIQSYQRLEFLGDSILDYLVMREILTEKPDLDVEEMHRCKSAVTNAQYMAFVCLECHITKEQNHIVQDPTVSESATTSNNRNGSKESTGSDVGIQFDQVLSRKCLAEYLRHSSPEIVASRRKLLFQHSQARKMILDQLEHGPDFPWAQLTHISAEKCFSDVIESIIGAMYIDSGGDMEVLAGFLQRLGIKRHLSRLLRDGVDCYHPKNRIHMLANKRQTLVQFKVVKSTDEKRCTVDGNEGMSASSSREQHSVRVIVTYGERDIAEAEGPNKSDAETRAAARALEVLSNQEKQEKDLTDTEDGGVGLAE